MDTDREKWLWRMLYKSQVALAKRVLSDMNDTDDAKDGCWPCGMGWHQCNGSSHAIFFRKAREAAGIDHGAYLELLHGDDDALAIAVEELVVADAESKKAVAG